MSLISRMRKQDAVYWAPSSHDRYGKVILSNPVAIKCRWEDGQFEVQDKTGALVNSSTVVYVDRDVALEGMLWLGMLEDLGGSMTPPESARKIVKFDKVPNLKATEYLRTAYLI